MTDDENLMMRPREFSDDLLLPQNTDELAKFMDEPLSAIAEVITGAMAAGPKTWMVMGGRIIQSVFKAKLFQQVAQEIKELREKGKLPDDYADEKKYKYGFKSWVELFTFIDEQAPDADRLDAVRAMFYGVNKISASDAERIVNYQLLQIAKILTSGELLLLRAIYESHKNNDFTSTSGAIPLTTWGAKIASRLGHGLTSLVYKDETALTEQRLISRRLNTSEIKDDQQQVLAQNSRLTDLGIKFWNAIETYHRDTQ